MQDQRKQTSESSPQGSGEHTARSSRTLVVNAASGTHAALDPDPGMSGVLGAVRAASTPIDDPDFELIESWKQGSNAALDLLFQRVQPRIYGLCLRMLGRPEVASDVAQGAFLRMYEGLPGFDGRSRFSTWSIRVALNCVYTHLRREKLRNHARLPDEGSGGELGTGEPSPLSRVESRDLRRNVVAALGMVDLQARAILVLRDLQGLDYGDIAEVLGIPIGTVKSRLFRARTALREALERMGHGCS